MRFSPVNHFKSYNIINVYLLCSVLPAIIFLVYTYIYTSFYKDSVFNIKKSLIQSAEKKARALAKDEENSKHEQIDKFEKSNKDWLKESREKNIIVELLTDKIMVNYHKGSSEFLNKKYNKMVGGMRIYFILTVYYYSEKNISYKDLKKLIEGNKYTKYLSDHCAKMESQILNDPKQKDELKSRVKEILNDMLLAWGMQDLINNSKDDDLYF